MEPQASRCANEMLPSPHRLSLAAEADVRQLQDSLSTMRQDMEKTLGDKAVPLGATDTERVVCVFVSVASMC